ncbi:MAG: helix-turn-helix domain-containing protein [Mycoplasmatales bacterium]
MNFEERKIIARLFRDGSSLSSIARLLKRSKIFICLEVKRHGVFGTHNSRKRNLPNKAYTYSFNNAQIKYIERRNKNLKYDFNFFK